MGRWGLVGEAEEEGGGGWWENREEGNQWEKGR